MTKEEFGLELEGEVRFVSTVVLIEDFWGDKTAVYFCPFRVGGDLVSVFVGCEADCGWAGKGVEI